MVGVAVVVEVRETESRSKIAPSALVLRVRLNAGGILIVSIVDVLFILLLVVFLAPNKYNSSGVPLAGKVDLFLCTRSNSTR